MVPGEKKPGLSIDKDVGSDVSGCENPKRWEKVTWGC